jgi:hypothetical protein
MLCTLLKEQQQPSLFGERGRKDLKKKIKIHSFPSQLPGRERNKAEGRNS